VKVEERLERIVSLIQNPAFKKDMENFGRENASLFTRLLLSCWQGILKILSSMFGAFCEAQKPFVWVHSLDKLTKSAHVSKSMFPIRDEAQIQDHLPATIVAPI
jgi:hypothetical protein